MLDHLVHSLGIVPKNFLSLTVGSLARTRFPSLVAKPLHKMFVDAFKINMTEAERPLSDYDTIEDIFTRKLKPGSRPVASGYVSPSDGTMVKSEPCQKLQAIQAKGINYCLGELVWGKSRVPTNFESAWFSTIYLAPHNYHRVHSPFTGRATALRYIPGQLWPVNAPAVRVIPSLFCRNERLVFDFELDGGGKAWVIMVGALNVGRIVTPLLPEFVSNAAKRQFRLTDPVETKIDRSIAAGDEIGTFMLGSTVVVVLDGSASTTLRPVHVTDQRTVKMGQSLSV